MSYKIHAENCEMIKVIMNMGQVWKDSYVPYQTPDGAPEVLWALMPLLENLEEYDDNFELVYTLLEDLEARYRNKAHELHQDYNQGRSQAAMAAKFEEVRIYFRDRMVFHRHRQVLRDIYDDESNPLRAIIFSEEE